MRAELRAAREESAAASREARAELARGLAGGNAQLTTQLKAVAEVQRTQLEGVSARLGELTESNRKALDGVRATIDTRLIELQAGNEKKLEQMRVTVDEKLQSTLEKRLGESFKLVSDQLESVQKGLGEMQSLATGVGDLKRVLTNVKARGTWAEVQLGALLEEILTPAQFERNVHVEPGSRELVEYAVRLPGPKDDPAACVWLPIDSKFPQEDYARVQDAADCGDAEAARLATEGLARSIRLEAQSIHDKYVKPPHTTDFGIMFLATEGLYAEVVRQPALVEDLQQRYRVVVAGPTTLAALLSSLRMGFQTLAIEQQAVEVWRVLGAVKTEFGKFGERARQGQTAVGHGGPQHRGDRPAHPRHGAPAARGGAAAGPGSGSRAQHRRFTRRRGRAGRPRDGSRARSGSRLTPARGPGAGAPAGESASARTSA